ncbi:alginate lyase family protein [Paenibacillus cellulositrophicus]|uniref:heparinase II/III family protein n=1 Tax=Paenibacillus cellulositrophicus TaxID=562959 RepID=UPI003F81498F
MSTLMMKVKKLRRMPLHAAAAKVAEKALDETRTAYLSIRHRLAPAVLKPSLFSGFRSRGRFLFDPQDKKRYTELLRKGGADTEIIRQADRICAHEFDLLGSGPVSLGEQLPWHEDFKSGFRWEPRYYKRIRTVDLSNRADVKVPWELSRFQHVFTLGKAYWLTGREAYALEFQAQLDDWIQENPPEMSVNWTCAMDVAIRAVNWIAGIYFFRDSPSLPEAFWDRLHASLYRHGGFIMDNLENTGEHTGNHYLSNLAGLIGLGLYFGDIEVRGKGISSSSPKEWLAYGIRETEREMFVQVNGDGSNYEASTSYHRLVAELFVLASVWCRSNGIEFTPEYMKRLEKMHEFMLDLMKQDGRTPVVGDADDGHVMIASGYGRWAPADCRHMLAVAGELFDRDDFRAAGRLHREEAMWIAGLSTLRPYAAPERALSSRPCAAYPDGGYYVLRSSLAYCLVRCGELSFRGHGAHSHNDQLSFELQVSGQDIFVDPGAYIYSADYRLRNLFRSTGMHNTVQVGGHEQNDFDEHELFLMREQTFARCVAFREGFFAGSHSGYAGKCGVIHRRVFDFHEGELTLSDRLDPVSPGAEEIREFTASFMLAPGAAAAQTDGIVLIRQAGVTIHMSFEGASAIQLEDSWVSERYGVRRASRLIRVRSSHPEGLSTRIRWK